MSTSAKNQVLQSAVFTYYQAFGRYDLPWRIPEADGSFDPYKIMVSEIMLQQTQVSRVAPKYHEFIAQFPSVQVLAEATLSDVLRTWSGLGYNRRAKFLHLAAKEIDSVLGGVFPRDIAELTKLPGIGKNTAGAIRAYAYNLPSVFIETNIRSVYIHHFFKGRQDVSDNEIMVAVAETLPTNGDYRTWYWALMDYGSHLKQVDKTLNTLSKSYSKQSRFEGSRRQIRGQIIKQLTLGEQSIAELRTQLEDTRLDDVLHELLNEGLIQHTKGMYSL